MPTRAVPSAPTFAGKSADEQLLDEFAGTRILLLEDEPILAVIANAASLPA